MGGAAAEGCLKVCVEGCVGWYREIGGVSAAAPCDEGVCSRSYAVDIHHVASGFEFVAGFVFLPHYVAVGVDDIESHLVDFCSESIGILEVAVVDEAYFVVRVAVALILVDKAVAGGESRECQHRQQPRECL